VWIGLQLRNTNWSALEATQKTWTSRANPGPVADLPVGRGFLILSNPLHHKRTRHHHDVYLMV